MKSLLNVPRWVSAPVLVMSMLLAAGCGGNDDEAPAGNGTVAPVTTGTVSGTVLDAQSGQPLAGVTISAGALSTTTDAQGRFSLAQVPPSLRAALVVSKANYAENVLITSVAANSTTRLSTQLLPVAATGTINPTAGGTVTVAGSTAQFTVPANALVREDGQPLTGSVTARLTPINPALNPAFMPGDYTGSRPTGSNTLESFGAIALQLTDASGAKVKLAAGKTATIRIPVGSRGAVAASIPLGYFDTATALWVQEGTATLAGTGDNQYYEGTISRISVWDADQYYDTVKVSGCVKNAAGQAVTGARVAAEGIDYSGVSSVQTDASGKFVLPMKRSSKAVVTAFNGLQQSNSITATTEAVDLDVSAQGCLTMASSSNTVSIKLSWGKQPLDVDSHLWTPNGDHIAFYSPGSLAAAPNANLDVDDVDSFGPEVVTVNKLMVGTYTYALHNYSRYSEATAPGLTPSPVRVELNAAGAVSSYSPPAGEAGASQLWTAFRLVVDAQCRITVTPVNTWSNDDPFGAIDPVTNEPVAPTVTTPTYCTPQ